MGRWLLAAGERLQGWVVPGSNCFLGRRLRARELPLVGAFPQSEWEDREAQTAEREQRREQVEKRGEDLTEQREPCKLEHL